METEKIIMVVDDDKEIRDSVSLILKKEGYKVTTALGAEDCLKKVKRKKPDLILLDIMMPGKPVKELLAHLDSIKIAYLSIVWTTDAEREALIKKNIVGFIQKPFTIKELLKGVKKSLK